MKRPGVFLILLFLLKHNIGCSQSPDSPFPAYQMDGTETRVLSSKTNGIDYQLYISYPPSFKNKLDKEYPVLYLLDADYSFAIAKNIVDHLSERNHLQEIIVVGIAYKGEKRYRLNRTRDYTPTNSEELVSFSKIQSEYSGGGEAFKDFIQNELIPFIKKEYRANEQAVISGHSYGGLFVSWLLTQHPDLFGGYIIVSPSLWYDDHLIMRSDWELAAMKAKPIKVYCAVGDREVNQQWNMPVDLKAFVDRLEQHQWSGLDLSFKVMSNETHNSVFPTALSNGIRHVFEGL